MDMETPCETVRTKLGDLREGKLDRRLQTAVEQHLHYCEDCILKWALVRVPRQLAESGAR